ncbi:flavin reductase family protein [Paenalkalicoccus suaedae]|uniref:Flavin reductase family protein n=1 Tax=Paenalkalicoccus suaedae TaxID=2592382 RepID=A0A859FD90_9BACI|nr:flavin reductase family protein [Paenalkalicoccus suaedae]QKS70544.1 flavin reductase family protein [Paenalkalicoccus suaedae]
MTVIESKSLTKRDHYKLMTSIITPRPIAFVSSLSEEGVLNVAPFSYFSIISADPPLVSVSIGRKGTEQKDTARNIVGKKQFVVHVTTEENVEKANESAANLAPDESEAERAELEPVLSHFIDVPGIRESPVRMECELYAHHVIEGEDATTDLIIGKIVAYHVEEKLLIDNNVVDTGNLKPVSRLGGTSYAKLGKQFSLERPK